MREPVLRQLTWKCGFEVELMAPPDASRRDLADVFARASGGSVRRSFCPQSEPSAVPDKPVFESLTLAFDALDANGQLIARCVDDITLQHGLDRQRPPRDGWYRIVSDDRRFLNLIERNCSAADPLEAVLEPAARLFGTELEHDDGMVRLADDMLASIAIALPLPGERERPCEIVTPPLTRDHAATLAGLLAHADRLGFTVPLEAAVHIHFDAAPLRSARVVARLVAMLATHGASLRELVGTNPNCRRLGPLPDALIEVTQQPDFAALDWEAAQERLREAEPKKYCDFNLANLIHGFRHKPTVEVRILPGSMDAEEITGWAELFQDILHWCTAEGPANAAPPMPGPAHGRD
jgi:Putative amidoligase enzyme